MAIVLNKYCVLYNDDKSIKALFFGSNQSVNTPHSIYGTNNCDLYEDENTFIDYKKLKRVEESVEQTLLNYDD